ncbi:phage holin [Streptococcus cuniculi]|uniref:Holin n=1 Tax=Streptococcus cuniculi TaxID=1432788 RepID=A0A4Y9JBM5_9STRE|nr:phage holin [Streptococcus cuniculi]MBF0778221.1 holin [Streptococcus cuniculi]TFU97961.1 holin [Streptococcus cuniculi]
MNRLKIRFRRQMFWIGLMSLLLMLVDNILVGYFNIEISRALNQIEQTACIIFSTLVFLGVLNKEADIEPPTKG